jgi:hypothetical protein
MHVKLVISHVQNAKDLKIIIALDADQVLISRQQGNALNVSQHVEVVILILLTARHVPLNLHLPIQQDTVIVTL